MKKAMKAALCILSAITMASAGAVQAAAGTLSKEELIEKYAPEGAYNVREFTQKNFQPYSSVTYYGIDDSEIDMNAYVQAMIDDIDAENMTDEEYQQAIQELTQNVIEKFQSIDRKAIRYNDYRSGYNNQQWFRNCEYADGFWYILDTDGTASIVGAEQEYFKGKTVMQIPSEIGGAIVTKIEDRAFEMISGYLPDVKDIVLPDTVETIGTGAFAGALTGADCKITLSEGVKYIGRYAFYNSTQCLADEFLVIKIPESVEFIGAYALEVNDKVTCTNDPNSPLVHLSGFSWETVHAVLDMPESLVMFEDNMIDIDQLRANRGCPRTDAMKLYTYAEVNSRDPETRQAVYEAYSYAYDTVIRSRQTIDKVEGNMVTMKPVELTEEVIAEFQDALLNYGAPLTELDIQLIHETVQFFMTVYGGTVTQYDKVNAFCEKYDMTQQRAVPHYMFNGNVFLYDEGNYIDMNDVSAYYAQSEPKPAEITTLAGDVDNNGTIDVSDAVLLARFCAEEQTVTMTAAGRANADVNSDGLVTNEDVVAIEKIIAKL